MDKIAGQPSAAWMGNWNPQIEMDVKTLRLEPRPARGGLPVMILYNLPFRDCGLYSAGGRRIGRRATASGSTASRAGIGSRRAVFVLEPDGLPLHDQVPQRRRSSRNGSTMIRYAVEKLTALPGAAVYIDAGHSAWMPARRDGAAPEGGGDRSGRRLLAQRLELPGDARSAEVRPRAVGAARRQALHHRHRPQRQRRRRRVRRARTSATGATPTGARWARRPRPTPAIRCATRSTGSSRPGESDGTCNNGPAAGALVAREGAGDGPQREVVGRASPTTVSRVALSPLAADPSLTGVMVDDLLWRGIQCGVSSPPWLSP